MKQVLVLGLAVVALGLSACGQGTDPYKLMNDSSRNINTVPALLFPVDTATAGIVTPTITPFSSSNDGIDLNWSMGTLTAVNVRAPAAGVVTEVAVVENTNQYRMTIYHTPVYSTRVSKLATLSAIRVGDPVIAGQLIGTVTNVSPSIHFTVLANGAAVCPYSYLDADGKSKINTASQTMGLGTYPCTN